MQNFNYKLLATILCMLLGSCAITQSLARDEGVCQKTSLTIPAAEIEKDIQSAKSLGSCDPIDFYYGLKGEANYLKARQCAFLKKDYWVLTMIYANGKGTPKNIEAAIYFGCRAGFSQGDVEARIDQLLEMNKNSQSNDAFEFCDHIVSGYLMGQCAHIQSRLDQAAQQKQLASLIANWSEADKQSLQKLRNAAEQFFAVRVENEVDLSGTARAALQIEERDLLEKEWISSLKKINAGQFPDYTVLQFQQEDRKLNQVYKKIQEQEDFSIGTITREGVKKTQRAWIKYRNAWLEFARQKYPQVQSESWEAWLTQQRIEMLKEFTQ